ncbi:MAG: fatty acid desaturase [Immundisolibacter sp.]
MNAPLPDSAAERFALDDMRRIVADLFAYRPGLYWLDFCLSAGLGYLLALVYLTGRGPVAAQALAFVGAGVLLFRAGTFMHEIVHMNGQAMPGFRLFWNLTYGIPLLMPSLMYRNHLDHHNVNRFGTPQDGEYLPLGSAPPVETVKYLLQVPILPLLAVLRFLVVTPLSYLHPGLRRWVMRRVSSYGSNPYYQRALPADEPMALWALQEWACFAWLACLATLFATGVLPWAVLGKVYLLMTFAVGLNWVRNLAAHKYVNTGARMSYQGQLEDSINITGQTWLTALLFPVGLRYHALHHLFPAMPYHAMGEAHRRLMAQLPADAAYRKTDCPNFFAAVSQLWQGARRSAGNTELMRAWRRLGARGA